MQKYNKKAPANTRQWNVQINFGITSKIPKVKYTLNNKNIKKKESIPTKC